MENINASDLQKAEFFNVMKNKEIRMSNALKE